MGIFHTWVKTLTFLGHVTSSVTWPCDSTGAIFYRCSIVTESLSPTIFEIMGILYIWVTTLTFLGHVTSSVTWLFDSTGAISYRCSFATESLSLTFFNIMVILYIWVTILTFLGHVTSSVMWPIDPPYPFPIGVPLEPNLYLEPFSRYLHPNISGSRLDLSTSRDVIVHVTIWFPRCHFL